MFSLPPITAQGLAEWVEEIALGVELAGYPAIGRQLLKQARRIRGGGATRRLTLAR